MSNNIQFIIIQESVFRIQKSEVRRLLMEREGKWVIMAQEGTLVRIIVPIGVGFFETRLTLTCMVRELLNNTIYTQRFS